MPNVLEKLKITPKTASPAIIRNEIDKLDASKQVVEARLQEAALTSWQTSQDTEYRKLQAEFAALTERRNGLTLALQAAQARLRKEEEQKVAREREAHKAKLADLNTATKDAAKDMQTALSLCVASWRRLRALGEQVDGLMPHGTKHPGMWLEPNDLGHAIAAELRRQQDGEDQVFPATANDTIDHPKPLRVLADEIADWRMRLLTKAVTGLYGGQR